MPGGIARLFFRSAGQKKWEPRSGERFFVRPRDPRRAPARKSGSREAASVATTLSLGNSSGHATQEKSDQDAALTQKRKRRGPER